MKAKDWESILTEKADLSQMNRAKNGEMLWAMPLLYVAGYMLVDMTLLANYDMATSLNSLLNGGFLMAGACMMLAGWLFDHCGNTIYHCIIDDRGAGLDKLLKKRKMYAAVMGGVPAVVFIAGLIMQFTGQKETYELLIKARTSLIYIVPALWGAYGFMVRKNFKELNRKING